MATSKRPALPKVSEEMKRWSALLSTEMKRWPDTRLGSMFGMVSVYRGDKIFALLPGTRAWNVPNAMATKQNAPGSCEGRKWEGFTIENDNDLRAALERLDQAYRSAEK